MEKKVLIGPEENQYEPPEGLHADENFKRLGELNPGVVQDETDPNKITLFSRLIYTDKHGLNSCITEKEAILEGKDVKILPGETTIFQAEAPHGQRGVEDFSAIKLNGEKPLHGFLVHYNGFDARTEYVRTSKDDPDDHTKWQEFGIYFPNIRAKKAISLVKQERYKEYWDRCFGETAIKKTIELGNPVPKSPFLGTKDCCLFPRKVKRKDENGDLREYYGIIIRLLPDMQMVYVKGFKELASRKFWRKTVKNLDDYVLLERENDWEKSHIGLGGVPLELDHGILIPYHGVVMDPKRNYQWGAALVDKDDPHKILARTKKPIISATEPWEKNGVVDGDVVFPTGYAISDGIFHGFYGAGDKYLAHFTTTESELLNRVFE
ncbi:hypothetical protein GOV14_04340 [Candidatus Pacearchaeota archaeon]|nr:hypothetical protein [Candidatus Pacearchaeota archaeon]